MQTRREILVLGAGLCGSCFSGILSAQTIPRPSTGTNSLVTACGNERTGAFVFDRSLLRSECQQDLLNQHIDGEINNLNAAYRFDAYKPTFSFYDDRDNPMGAKALRRDTDKALILLGYDLIDREARMNPNWMISVGGTLAHEWAHALHYRSRLDDKRIYWETHADYMSGWYFGILFSIRVIDFDPTPFFAQFLYIRGSSNGYFEERDYGAPQQRADAMLLGFEFALSELNRYGEHNVYRAANDGYRTAIGIIDR